MRLTVILMRSNTINFTSEKYRTTNHKPNTIFFTRCFSPVGEMDLPTDFWRMF